MSRTREPVPRPAPAAPGGAALPDEVRTLIDRAQDRVDAGDLEAGLLAFEELAERFSDLPELHNDLGALCTTLQRYEAAAKAFARAVELRPEAANGHFNLGMIHFRLGSYLDAVQCFEAASERSPQDPEILNNLGVAHFQLQAWTEARRAFEGALRLRPDYLAAGLNLVDVDLAEGRCEEAWRRCRALTPRSGDPQIWAKLGQAALRRSEQVLEETATAFEEAVQLFPADAGLREDFGRVVRARETLLAAAAPPAG